MKAMRERSDDGNKELKDVMKLPDEISAEFNSKWWEIQFKIFVEETKRDDRKKKIRCSEDDNEKKKRSPGTDDKLRNLEDEVP